MIRKIAIATALVLATTVISNAVHAKDRLGTFEIQRLMSSSHQSEPVGLIKQKQQLRANQSAFEKSAPAATIGSKQKGPVACDCTNCSAEHCQGKPSGGGGGLSGINRLIIVTQ